MNVNRLFGGLLDKVIDVASTAAKVVGGLVSAKDKVTDTFVDTAVDAAKKILPKTAEEQVQAKLVDGFKKAAKAQQSTEATAIPTNSRFYDRLANHFLTEYLANPTKETAEVAIGKIGAKFEGTATPGYYWEEVALSQWNSQPIPAALRQLRPKLPANIAAATNVLSQASVAKLPFIDVPQLIGGDNADTGVDKDVSGGGRNISQLMHWATGVKYCELDTATARDLFFAYEMWHLEGWDVFGEDSINDMIAEESGRLLGNKLRGCEITKENLADKVGECLHEARAWVGSILALRSRDLDKFAASKEYPQAKMWWKDATEIWPKESLLARALKGASIDDVVKSGLGQRIVGIYTLIEEAKDWEKKNGSIKHTLLIDNLISGKLDRVLAAAAQGTDVTPLLAASAFVNAGGRG